MNLNNTVIKVLNSEHGKKVIQFFKDNGVNTRSLTGDIDNLLVGPYVYYGLCDISFGSYSENIVKRHGLKIITLPEKTLTFPRKMLVWDTFPSNMVERIVLCVDPKTNKKYPYICLTKASNAYFEEGVNTEIRVIRYRNAKEIPAVPEAEEMTLEQVCKELGREVKIIK